MTDFCCWTAPQKKVLFLTPILLLDFFVPKSISVGFFCAVGESQKCHLMADISPTVSIYSKQGLFSRHLRQGTEARLSSGSCYAGSRVCHVFPQCPGLQDYPACTKENHLVSIFCALSPAPSPAVCIYSADVVYYLQLLLLMNFPFPSALVWLVVSMLLLELL